MSILCVSKMLKVYRMLVSSDSFTRPTARHASRSFTQLSQFSEVSREEATFGARCGCCAVDGGRRRSRKLAIVPPSGSAGRERRAPAGGNPGVSQHRRHLSAGIRSACE